jgi:ABC-type uncharacterized transport system involved in gliding motility auxiliary subunit
MDKKRKNPAARWAFIGLIVALLGCISSGLLGIVQGIIALQIYTPTNPQTLTLALQISVAVLIVGLAAYILMTPDTVRRFLSGRQARYGSNSLIMTLAFVGIIFVVNYIVFQNPKSWDLTEDKSHTLAPETLQALATLPGNVNAIAFYSANLPTENAENLLRDFKANSKGKFDYQFINPDLDPLAAREAGVTGDGKIMLVMGERKEIASSASETELTRTLIRLISPEARAVYFLTGHGEGSIDSGSTPSFSTARTTLESKNYTVNTLNLLETNKVPEDALAIIVSGPQKPLADQEVSLLKQYVDAGGSLVVMEDPTFFTEFGESPDPLADYLQTDWGVVLDNDIVIDLVNTQNPFQAVSSQYSPTHPITQNLTVNYIVILPQARSISLNTVGETITQTAIILTTQQSWGEMNLVSSETPAFEEGTDIPGPLNLAVAAENSETKGRVVVFGNSIFATDEAFDAYGNGNIFINSVDWAAEQDDLINITPRTPVERMFILPTLGNAQLILVSILIFSIFLLPGLVLVAGISSWISRRRRG